MVPRRFPRQLDGGRPTRRVTADDPQLAGDAPRALAKALKLLETAEARLERRVDLSPGSGACGSDAPNRVGQVVGHQQHPALRIEPDAHGTAASFAFVRQK